MRLRDYQLDAACFLADAGRALYADPPGVGKTAVALSTATMWGGRTLVVCPNGVTVQWMQETLRMGLSPSPGYGTAMQRQKSREQYKTGGVFIINYESARIDADRLQEMKWDNVIFDESHWMKDRKTALYKRMVKIARRAEHLLLISGTPILNGAEELWTSLSMMAPKGYTSFWRWADEHLIVERTNFNGSTPQPIEVIHGLKPGHGPLIRAELDGHFLARPLEQLMPDLPKLRIYEQMIELPPEERKVYERLKRAHRVGEVVTTNTVSQITRMRQLASDWGELTGEKPGEKLATAAEWMVAEIEGAVAVTNFRSTAELLGRMVDTTSVIHGGVKPIIRRNRISDFRTGNVDSLVGTIATMGEGVDGLQDASKDLIMVDRDWSPLRNRQVIGRLLRSGQANDVTVHQLIAMDTIDEQVSEVLLSKTAEVESIFGPI